MTSLPPADRPSPVPLRWIPPCRLDGAWQMAIDAWLLDRLDDDPLQATASLRLYTWSRPTLSLGWHQRRLEPHWDSLAARGRIDLVRRPSGGRAVLHGGDLTYALVWPRPGGDRREVYGRALEWLIQAFAAMGHPLQAGRQSTRLQRPSCFATSTLADLVQADGVKRVGSAQLWRRGHLLQHGSIQLAPSARLWREVFGSEAPVLQALPLQGADLVAHLRDHAARWWPLAQAGSGPPAEARPGPNAEASLALGPLSSAEREAIDATVATYRVAGGARGVTSPEATMPRAT